MFVNFWHKTVANISEVLSTTYKKMWSKFGVKRLSVWRCFDLQNQQYEDDLSYIEPLLS